MSHMPIVQLTKELSTYLPAGIEGGQNTCLYIPLAYVRRSALSREQWRLALSKLEKLCCKGRGGLDRLGL